MVEFGTGYGHLMDREYAQYGHNHEHTHHGGEDGSPVDSTNDVGVTIGDLGMSMGLGPVPNVQAIGAKIRPGGKEVEFVFTGMGKGSGQGQTPEMYGFKQRQALVEMGKANRVDFTTHSTVGVYGLAGIDQQGNFSKSSKNASLQEVKRAIEFAADVSRGGPVVVHTGEFFRPIADADWNKKEDQYSGKFQMYETEAERTSYRVVDTRTGALIQEARKNRKVSRPVWNTTNEGQEYEDFDGQKRIANSGHDERGMTIYVDYFGKRRKPEERVPRFTKEGDRFEIHQMSWEEVTKEAEELTMRAKDEFRKWKFGRLSDDEVNRSIWRDRFFRKDVTEDKIRVLPEEAYIISTLETSAANSRGWAVYHGGNFQKNIDDMEKLQRALKMYEEIERTTDPEEQWKLKQHARDLVPGLVPDEAKKATEVIRDYIKEHKRHMDYAQESSASQWAQAEEAVEQIRHVQSATSYAINEAYDAYADLALIAMRQSNKLKEEGKLKEPLRVAMENLFPEHYGSHPDEVIELVSGSRERMELKLKQMGMSSEEAHKKSQDHITATFDTGHLNMWRKYWKSDSEKSLKENEDDFNKWVIVKVGEMAKKNIIGHVHLDDNYGYQDDHLAPGEGNTPIKDIIRTLKANGYKGRLIVEPGADYTTDVSGFHSVMKTWRHFNIPVYGSGSGVSSRRRTWNQVGYGFFGQNEPPYFAVGAYIPSEDWTLWSGVPLE